jgi:hypothetical protein
MMSAYRLGTWAAGAVAAIGHAYITVLIAGFVQVGFDAPIGDPVLAAMEILTLFSAPAVLITMASVHHHAAPEHKILYWHPRLCRGTARRLLPAGPVLPSSTPMVMRTSIAKAHMPKHEGRS